MAEYPILAQKKIIIDSEAIEIFGYDNSTFTYNGEPIMPRGNGVTTLAPIGSSPNEDGGTILSSTLTLQPADDTFGGVISSTTQDIPGEKTMKEDLFLSKNLNLPATAADSSTGCILVDGSTILHTYPSQLRNMWIGLGAGNQTSISSDSVGIGNGALSDTDTGQFNIALGGLAGEKVTTSSNLTLLGTSAGRFITSGSSNTICIGNDAGISLTSTSPNCIIIGESGTVGDNHTIKIGEEGTHTTCFLQGISGVTSAGAVAAVINSDGKLGTVVSSRKRKQNIQPVGERAQKLRKVEIVSFNMIDDPSQELHYGAIAEDVEPIFPECIVYADRKKEIPTIQYHKFIPLLLKLAQEQQMDIDDLKFQLSELKK